MKPEINILFVCLGNICRSPMAEYLMREKIKQAKLDNVIFTDSAGTSGWHDGEDMHKRTKEVLIQKGIDASGFMSRKVTVKDWDMFDYIIAMDNNNLGELEFLFGKNVERVFNIASLCPGLTYDHIPDPWITNKFEETYQLLDQCCDKLLEKVKAKL